MAEENSARRKTKKTFSAAKHSEAFNAITTYLTHDGQVYGTPGVGTPVYQPRTEVCRQNAKNGGHYYVADALQTEVPQY